MTLRHFGPAIALACLACVTGEDGDACLASAFLAEPAADSSVALRACALQREYAVGEPVELLVALRGAKEPVTLLNNPDFYRFDVTDEGGATVVPVVEFSATQHFGRRAELTLPSRGAVSYIADLTCLRPMLTPADTLLARCWQRYEFEPGVYRIIVRFGAAKVTASSDSAGATPTLAAAPVLIRIR